MLACDICGDEITVREPDVDHDHETGLIRGRLCSPCNLGLGSFRDDIGRLQLAIEYLADPPGHPEFTTYVEFRNAKSRATFAANRKIVNARQRAKYASDLEGSRKYNREKQQRLRIQWGGRYA